MPKLSELEKLLLCRRAGETWVTLPKTPATMPLAGATLVGETAGVHPTHPQALQVPHFPCVAEFQPSGQIKLAIDFRNGLPSLMVVP